MLEFIRRVLKLAFFCLGLCLWSGSASALVADAQCSSVYVKSLTVSPTTLTPSFGSTTFGSGSITLEADGCYKNNNNVQVDPGIYLTVNIPPQGDPAPTTASGVGVQLSGPPTYSSTSSNCTYNSSDSIAWTYGGIGAGTMPLSSVAMLVPVASSSPCNVTATFNFQFTKNAGNLTSCTPTPCTIYANTLLNNPPGGQFGNGWASYGYINGAWTPISAASPALTIYSAQACALSPPNPVFKLPTVGTSAVAVPNSPAANVPITLTLSGCPGGSYTPQLTWSFNPVAGYPNLIQNTASSSLATNVYVQILDAGKSPITNGATTNFTPVTSAGGTYSATYYAGMVSTGSPGPGYVTGLATITLGLP